MRIGKRGQGERDDLHFHSGRGVGECLADTGDDEASGSASIRKKERALRGSFSLTIVSNWYRVRSWLEKETGGHSALENPPVTIKKRKR